MDRLFRFYTELHVTLANGEAVNIHREILVEAPDADYAQLHLRSVATEMCHDAGSDWFDAPVDDVRIVNAARVG
jgi:hypothetical protein